MLRGFPPSKPFYLVLLFFPPLFVSAKTPPSLATPLYPLVKHIARLETNLLGQVWGPRPYLDKHLAAGRVVARAGGRAVHRHGLAVAGKLQGALLLHQLLDHLRGQHGAEPGRLGGCRKAGRWGPLPTRRVENPSPGRYLEVCTVRAVSAGKAGCTHTQAGACRPARAP